MNRTCRLSAWSVMVGLAAIGLTACDTNMMQGPLSIKREGSVLLVTVCTDITPEKVLMEQRSPGEEWDTFWRASSSNAVVSGFQVSTNPSTADPFESVVRRGPNLLAGDELAVLFADSTRSAVAAFRVDDMVDDLWLRGDGSTSAQACQ